MVLFFWWCCFTIIEGEKRRRESGKHKKSMECVVMQTWQNAKGIRRETDINKKFSEGSTANSVVPGLHSNHLVHKSFFQSNALFFFSFTFFTLSPKSIHHSHSLKHPTKNWSEDKVVLMRTWIHLWCFLFVRENGASYNRR